MRRKEDEGRQIMMEGKEGRIEKEEERKIKERRGERSWGTEES